MHTLAAQSRGRARQDRAQLELAWVAQLLGCGCAQASSRLVLAFVGLRMFPLPLVQPVIV